MLKPGMIAFFLVQVWLSALAGAESLEIKNFNEIAKQLGFQAYYSQYASLKKKKVRIAILDNNFQSYEEELGKTLPLNTVLHKPPLAPSPDELKVMTKHALFMAQMLVKFMTDNNRNKDLEPELHLFPYSYLYSNFEWATKEVARLKVDIVLYSTVRDIGGNFDGKGFINQLVNKSLDAGVLWVNAAGNYAQSTYNAPIKVSKDDWIKLPGPNNTVAVRCEPVNKSSECMLQLTLSWTDFKDTTGIGTDKDLDLILYDDAMNIFENHRGVLTQKITTKKGESGTTLYPREMIEIRVKKGLYFARVKNISKNFGAADKMRLIGSGDGISFEQNTPDESLLNPADNARVLTVGALDTNRSSRSKKLNKPEIYAPSAITLPNDDTFLGTSNSAAIVAAGAGLMMMVQPDLTKAQLLARMTPPMSPSSQGLTLTALRFGPTGRTQNNQPCFQPVELKTGFISINGLFRNGGMAVETTEGIRIIVPQDPLLYAQNDDPRRTRNYYDDMIMATPNGFILRPRSLVNQTKYMPDMRFAFEVIQLPQEQIICGMEKPNIGNAKLFLLPSPQ